VEQELGRGGMGVVYRVYDTQMQRQVALKTINPEYIHDQLVAQRFRREIEIMRRVGEHPHIVRVLDEGVFPSGTPYFTMSYIVGEDLKKLIFESRHTLTLKDIHNLLEQIGSALAYAHGRKVSHRDIKPSNIIKDQYGQFYLTDFGIATHHDHSTQTRRFVGTKEYAAPEVLKGGHSTPRSDVYSLGITLLEVCLNSRYAEAYQQSNGAPFSFLQNHPVFAPFAPILQKAVHPDPEMRYATLADLAHDFTAQVMRSQIPPTLPTRAPAASLTIPHGGGAQRGERIALLLVLLVVAVLIVAFFAFLSAQTGVV
jgi:serine/threonine protein kinase